MALDAAMGEVDASKRINDNGFKFCSPLRLKSPFALGRDVKRLIYLDIDTIVLCDLEQLWETFDTWAEGVWFSVGSGSPKKDFLLDEMNQDKHLHRSPEFAVGGMNAGVLLISLERMRSEPGGLADYWNEVVRIVSEKGHKAPRFNATHHLHPDNLKQHPDGMLYYDQDILEIMSYDWPHRFTKLEHRYDWIWVPDDAKSLGAHGSSPICIEHFASGLISGYRDKTHAGLFAYWRDSRRIADSRQLAKRRVRSVPIIDPSAERKRR
jgi:hypothetical protein